MSGGPVDLDRVRSALARLDVLVESGTLDLDRTAAWLSGDLPEGSTMTATSRDDVPTSLRVPRSLLDRADALREPLSSDPTVVALAGPRGVSRSIVLRLAVERGIAALEADVRPGGPVSLRAELAFLQANLGRLMASLDLEDGAE